MSEAKETIRKHWERSAVFTGHLRLSRGYSLAENELRPGEVSATIFKVGHYTVRSAQRVYKNLQTCIGTEKEIPAGQEEVELVRKFLARQWQDVDWRFQLMKRFGLVKLPSVWGMEPWAGGLKLVQEISARHCNKPDGPFTMICRAAQARNFTWAEQIRDIYTAKESRLASEKSASLFVCHTYQGDSFRADTWYKFDPSGAITTLLLHPYDPNVDAAKFT